jgi:hypothetical protein
MKKLLYLILILAISFNCYASRIGSTDFMLEVAKGKVYGHSQMNKYGHNESVNGGPEDVWGGGGLYTFWDTNVNKTVEAVSTDVDDVGVLVSSGTATGGSLTTLIDTGANFTGDGVAVGDIVINDTNGEFGTVNEVTSATTLTHTAMTSGSTAQTALPQKRNFPNESGDTYRVASSADTGAGVISVEGLSDSSGIWTITTETVILNGQTDVAMLNQYVRLYRSSVLHAGSSAANEGDITVEIDATVIAGTFIAAMDGQTQQAVYTVPSGKSGYFVKGYVGLGSRANPTTSGASVFTWRARVNNGSTGVFAIKGQVEVMTTASQFWIYEYGVPVGIPEKTDILIRCDSTTADMGVIAAFDIVLVDN